MVAVVGGGVYALVAARSGPDAEQTLQTYLQAWNSGQDRAAARATDQPAEAAKALRANRRGLDGASVRARTVEVREDDARARARVRVTWNVPGIGDWSYSTRIELRKAKQRWRVRWAPTAVHPKLEDVTRLGTSRTAKDRADILDRNGRALVTERQVVHVGVARNNVDDIARTARTVAAAVDIDAKDYLRALRGAGPEQFVEAITLRRAAADTARAKLDGVDGVQFLDDRQPLAPTKGFARALLGTVAPATREQLDELAGDYGTGDAVGQWGLQAAFERQLAGTPSRRIVVRVGGLADGTLYQRGGRPGRPLRTTIDRDVQQAAESALKDEDQKAALVAVRPATGDVLAVANRPSDSSYDRALEGLYPPGSTFKVITTAALLRDGLRVQEQVSCPRTRDVEGKTFKNFEGGAGGAVPFAHDFAQSCNTAFVSLSDRLAPTALGKSARDFGLGRPTRLGVPAAEATVPPGRSTVERAAAMIGQDRIVASPLAMAGVAATVQDGRWRPPRLLANRSRADPGPRLADDEAAQLRSLMRRVVTDGTGNALAGVAGQPIGKSGTAEYGSGDPPPTHAWFIAARGDLALAVLVEGGTSGGSVAAPVAERFLTALDAS